MNPRAQVASANGERAAVTISREYDFPRESVFRMVTDPKKAAKWFGSPDGAEKLVFEVDARPMGAIRMHDRHGDGSVYKTTGTFLELVEPERVVFRTATEPPGSTAPFEALQTMVFEALGPKRTRVIVHVKVLAIGSFPGGIEALESGYRGGWGQSLDMLGRELR